MANFKESFLRAMRPAADDEMDREKLRESELPSGQSIHNFLKGGAVGAADIMVPGFGNAYTRGFGKTAGMAQAASKQGALDLSEGIGRVGSDQFFRNTKFEGDQPWEENWKAGNYATPQEAREAKQRSMQESVDRLAVQARKRDASNEFEPFREDVRQ